MDFRRGSGASTEILFGTVELKPTLMHSVGTSAVLPVATKADLVDGKVTIPNVAPSPAPVAGVVEWAYNVKVLDRFGNTFEWLVGVPDAVDPINFIDLPHYFETKPPLFGQGPQGVPGEAATIQIGTVGSGLSPAVSNTGTPKDVILNFTLPKGDKGDVGNTGPSSLEALAAQQAAEDAASSAEAARNASEQAGAVAAVSARDEVSIILDAQVYRASQAETMSTLAASEATLAASEAQDAARLVGVPAGVAVDVAISPGGAARATLTSAIDGNLPGRVLVRTTPGQATVEIQAKLDELDLNGGGTLEIPDTGIEHSVNATMYHGANTRIIGQGKGTSIGGVGGFTLFASKTPETRLDNVEISSLTINRYGSGSTADKPIIDWTGISHSKMQGVAVRQGTARASSVGIKLGLNSYYNEFNGVQARELDVCFKLTDAANGNRFTGGTAALFANNGFVVDNCNANAFLGASAEQLSGVGFDFLNGSKMNQVIGCRLEVMAVGARVQWSASNPAFNNFFMGNAFYMGEGQVEYVIQTDNTVIEKRHGYVLKNLYAADQRTFVSVYKNAAQGSIPVATWTRILFQNEDSDTMAEYGGSTFTAQKAGIYTVNNQTTFTSTAGTEVQVGLYKNGALYMLMGRGTTGAGPMCINGTRTISLTAGDTLEIWVNSNASGLNISSGRTSTTMQITRHG